MRSISCLRNIQPKFWIYLFVVIRVEPLVVLTLSGKAKRMTRISLTLNDIMNMLVTLRLLRKPIIVTTTIILPETQTQSPWQPPEYYLKHKHNHCDIHQYITWNTNTITVTTTRILPETQTQSPWQPSVYYLKHKHNHCDIHQYITWNTNTITMTTTRTLPETQTQSPWRPPEYYLKHKHNHCDNHTFGVPWYIPFIMLRVCEHSCNLLLISSIFLNFAFIHETWAKMT